ncbi:hypothetical protein LTA6_000552 [Microbacterium sp. LTA6]|uniref:hypothetical protein n=1 Tax=unclassified Microbacterium TaxID=2609290 RepID=UPI00313A1CAB
MMHTLIHTTSLLRNDRQRESRDLWPQNTTISEHDVVVGGRSLIDLARERRTPCVLIAPAAASGIGDSGGAYRTLVVATVTARRERRRWHREVDLDVDCDLRPIIPRVMHAELLNSPRGRDLQPMLIHSSDEESPMRVRLPEQTSPGDLVVFACAGTLALSQITPHRAAPRVSEDDEDLDQGPGRCMKH